MNAEPEYGTIKLPINRATPLLVRHTSPSGWAILLFLETLRYAFQTEIRQNTKTGDCHYGIASMCTAPHTSEYHLRFSVVVVKTGI